MTPAKQRLEMTLMAVESNPHFEVDDREVRRPGPSFTVDTLEELRGEGLSEIVLILGSDALADMPNWKEPEHIPELARLAVAEKGGGRREKGGGRSRERSSVLSSPPVLALEMPLLPISSTLIRQRVAAGAPIRYLVPEAVRHYVEAHGLYRPSPRPLTPDPSFRYTASDMSSEPKERPNDQSKMQALKSRISGLPDELLLDELTDQLNRTRQLLTGSPEEAAEAALERIGGQAEVEARIAAELAVRTPLAQPERFPEAHRITMRALEVLDREGFRNPRVPRLGPLKPVAEFLVEFVAEYIVKSYAESVVGRLRNLYARRETQSTPGTPERRLLAAARVEVDRLAPGFSGGGAGAPVLLIAGALVPILASISQYLGAIDVTSKSVQAVALVAAFVLFFSLSSVLLNGAAVARRRSRLIMRQPLAALWETVGHAGNPPEDDGVLFATIAIVLTALVWFVLPVLGLAVFYVF